LCRQSCQIRFGIPCSPYNRWEVKGAENPL
jgi:hypothetical protein